MPARLFLSSGDLMADRRFDFARDLQLKGDLAAAADLLMQAIELAPNFTSAWFTLGDIREELGEHEAAIAAFQKAQASDPGDRHGAGLRLMRLGAEPVSGMPQAYVQTLFDQYAPRFEASLVGRSRLSRPGAAVQGGAVGAIGRAASRRSSSAPSISAAAPGLRRPPSPAQVDHFIGVDLSPRMIERARATGLYAELEVADMLQGLRARPDASADLILAADAMVYVADLAPVLAEASRVLASGGLLAFTAETHGGEGVVIGQGLRYAHARRLRARRGRCRRPRIVAAGRSLRPQRGPRAGARPGRGRRENLSLDATRADVWRHCVRHVELLPLTPECLIKAPK